ncbi:MAG: hypothetical protein AAGK09_07595 [Planctomycetota bacterium]
MTDSSTPPDTAARRGRPPRDPHAWRWPSCGAAILAVGVLVMLAWPGGPARTRAAEPASAAAQRPSATQPAKPSRSVLLGIRDAKQRLGDAVPTGRGVDFAHVEGAAGDYMPDTQAKVFNGVDIVGKSGDSKTNKHAQGTARVLYGGKGLAPGVTDVSGYTTAGWMRDVLRLGTALPPAEATPRVHTHSWIGENRQFGDEVLLRTDHLVDTHDRLVVVGVNNGRDTPIPQLLASSYNAIAVGTASGDGASSGGGTRDAWPGRSKPDIVGAQGLTSFATPQVAAVVARLVEAAEAMPFYVQDADKSEVLKAVLLAGASKPWGWRQAEGRPLHDRYGAGIAHLDNSLKVLAGGPASLATPGEADDQRAAGRFGWWFGELEPGGRARVAIAAEAGDGPLSVVAVWHRRVDGETVITAEGGQRRGSWEATEGLADFDLVASIEGRAGGEEPARALLGLSRSRIDNVEHVFLPRLPGDVGEARTVWLDVIRPPGGGRGVGKTEAWGVALAWRIGGWDPADGPAGRE